MGSLNLPQRSAKKIADYVCYNLINWVK